MSDLSTAVDLPGRKRLRDLDRRADDRGEFAELLAGEMYGVRHAADESDWYDCRNASIGAKYEVKSTEVALDNGASGRFRLWEDQHRSLLGSDAAGTAWYVFVLFEDGGVRDVRRCRPSTVTKIVGEEWNLAGHESRDGRQLKVPWSIIL